MIASRVILRSARSLPDMDLPALTATAMALHRRFAAHARWRGARPWSRREIMEGFVVDVGALMKLVMAKEGVRPVNHVDRKLAHELADCLWSVLVLARLYEVDLGREFQRMVADVSEKLESPRKTTRPRRRRAVPRKRSRT